MNRKRNMVQGYPGWVWDGFRYTPTAATQRRLERIEKRLATKTMAELSAAERRLLAQVLQLHTRIASVTCAAFALLLVGFSLGMTVSVVIENEWAYMAALIVWGVSIIYTTTVL